MGESDEKILKSLFEFIEQLSNYYLDKFNEWDSIENHILNLKNNKVNTVFNFNPSGDNKYEFFNTKYLKHIEEYLAFLNREMIYSPPFDSIFAEINISSRVKAINSLLYKIINYCMGKEEKGNVPLNKCINDLQGYRVILDIDCEYDDLKSHLQNYLEKYRMQNREVRIRYLVAHRANNSYNAIHLYLNKMGNNFVFSWELQIWLKKYEKSNLESHAAYKQGYTKWELEIKNKDLE